MADIDRVCVSTVQLHWLEELYAYGNRVGSLPHEVCNLKKLRKLAVNENLLQTLPGVWCVGGVWCVPLPWGGGWCVGGVWCVPLPWGASFTRMQYIFPVY